MWLCHQLDLLLGSLFNFIYFLEFAFLNLILFYNLHEILSSNGSPFCPVSFYTILQILYFIGLFFNTSIIENIFPCR